MAQLRGLPLTIVQVFPSEDTLWMTFLVQLLEGVAESTHVHTELSVVTCCQKTDLIHVGMRALLALVTHNAGRNGN